MPCEHCIYAMWITRGGPEFIFLFRTFVFCSVTRSCTVLQNNILHFYYGTQVGDARRISRSATNFVIGIFMYHYRE